jgi:hypothetical protein
MTEFVARIVVSNDAKRPCVVWVEPWAEDFTLLTGENLEVLVRSSLAPPWFQLVHHDDSIQVYVEIEAAGTPTEIYLEQCALEVVQNDKPIHCGHNRQAAIDAGIAM